MELALGFEFLNLLILFMLFFYSFLFSLKYCFDWMHGAARCFGYPSDSTRTAWSRIGRQPAAARRTGLPLSATPEGRQAAAASHVRTVISTQSASGPLPVSHSCVMGTPARSALGPQPAGHGRATITPYGRRQGPRPPTTAYDGQSTSRRQGHAR